MQTFAWNENNRVGVFGGTFNPVHMGHLIVAQCALEAFELSSVLFVPCAVPPHKDASSLVAAHHRLAMLKLAVEHDLRFAVDELELRRNGVSYAVDTVRDLAARDPSSRVCFIIGSDTLPELHTWKDIYTLLKLCEFVTLERPGHVIHPLQEAQLQLDAPWPSRLLENMAAGRHIDISSSEIRYRVAEGLSIKYLVPDAVEMYIQEHHLYCSRDFR